MNISTRARVYICTTRSSYIHANKIQALEQGTKQTCGLVELNAGMSEKEKKLEADVIMD